MKIAVCITTHNRLKTFAKSLGNHVKFLPPNSRIFIVDDASDIAFGWHDVPEYVSGYRFERRAGVAAAKNKCLEMAANWGADHIFLFDDDTCPIAPDWWEPYVEHKEPHLMYQFKLPGKPASDMQVLYRDDTVVSYSHTRGAMLYIDRAVLDTVGGMDTAYGTAMYEHTDWTNRIHNAGLTTHRAMDVPSSDKLIYCMDQDAKVESSLSEEVKKIGLARNRRLYIKSKVSKEYKEFR